jgi:lipopolysaccharide export LptBFGC system permease protein LptF
VNAPAPRRMRRWVANAIWTIVGVGLYALCLNVFSRYPSWDSETLTWIPVVVIVLLGALVWYWHERRDEEP